MSRRDIGPAHNFSYGDALEGSGRCNGYLDTWTPGHQLLLCAKASASRARWLREAGREEAAQNLIAFALRYELMAVDVLLKSDHPDEVNIADFYKFAAIYAAESGDPDQAAKVLLAALERAMPDERLRRELRGLLHDIKQERAGPFTHEATE